MLTTSVTTRFAFCPYVRKALLLNSGLCSILVVVMDFVANNMNLGENVDHALFIEVK